MRELVSGSRGVVSGCCGVVAGIVMVVWCGGRAAVRVREGAEGESERDFSMLKIKMVVMSLVDWDKLGKIFFVPPPQLKGANGTPTTRYLPT